MSATALRLHSRTQAAPTPSWTLLAMAVMAAVVFVAVSAGGGWPLVTVGMIVIGAAFLSVMRFPFVGIMVFLTTFLINYPSFARGSGPVTINNLLGLVFVTLLAWDFYQHGDAWYLREPLVLALVGIGGLFIVGTIGSMYTLPDRFVQDLITKPISAVVYVRTDFTGRFMFQFFSRLAFAIFISKFVETPRQLLCVWLTLLVCIMAAVPPSLSSYIHASAADVRALTRVVNWADNANRFAFGCLIGVGICYYFGALTRSWAVRLLMLACAGLLLPLVLLSASRSGFLGIFLISGFILLGGFGRRQTASRSARSAAVFAFAGLGLITFFVILPEASRERILNLNPFSEQKLEGYKSTEMREATLKDSVIIIQEHPLMGVGLGNFRWVHKLDFGKFKPPHNSYVWCLSEGGFPLLAAYLLLYWMVWRRLGMLREAYADHPELPCFPDFLRVYLVMFMFFSLFADVWIEEHVFMIVGAAMLLDRWRMHPPQGAAAASPEGGAPGSGPGVGGGEDAPRRQFGWAAAPRPALVPAPAVARSANPARAAARRPLAGRPTLP